MKRLKTFENLQVSEKISSNDVWVVYSNTVSDVYEIYLKKEDAQIDCDLKNKQSNDYFKTEISYYKVVTLDEAIGLIKDEVRDEASSWDNPGY